MIKWRIHRRGLLQRYGGWGWSAAITDICEKYNCTCDFKTYMMSCTEEDYLIIKLQCPDIIDERVISFNAWCKKIDNQRLF